MSTSVTGMGSASPVGTVSTFITGMGCASPAGLDPESLWERVVSEQTAIQLGLGLFSEAQLEELSLLHTQPKNKVLTLSLYAMAQAMKNAGWGELRPDDGFIFATTTGFLSSWDKELIQQFKGELNPNLGLSSFQNERLGLLMDQICEGQNFFGPRLLVSTACSASTHALGIARLWLKQKKVKRVLVGATEVLSTLTIEGFKSFQLLSREVATPFNLGRLGINLSEASAFLCLEAESENPIALLQGAGFSSDAFHMTSPHPEGKGSAKAMQEALKSAGVSPQQISWVHAHGTGSIHNDLSESNAIRFVFGEGELSPSVSSTKGIHGHCLAAAGALESILCVLALKKQQRLGTFGFRETDPQIKAKIARESLQTDLNYVLKNTLGFGGSNGSLVFARVGAKR